MSDTAEVKIKINDIPDIAHVITPDHGCIPLSVNCRVNNADEDFDYMWVFSSDNTVSDTIHDPECLVELDTAGSYNIYLWASSAKNCNDSILIQNAVHVSDYPKASFTYSPDEPQNGMEVIFTNTSEGDDISSYNWNFGDGATSTEESPVHKYHLPNNDNMMVRFKVENIDGCADDTTMILPVNDNFAFWVPNSFTPNNDGINDIFWPRVNGLKSCVLRIFSRNGQLVFHRSFSEKDTFEESEGWDGTINGKPAAAGVYIWRIEYVRYSNEKQTLIKTGQLNLIR